MVRCTGPVFISKSRYTFVHKYNLQQYNMASQGSSDSSFENASVIRGHHIYKSKWTPVVEELALQQEDGNNHDKHTVVV